MSALGQIKWQCRRGSLELDLLLKSYVDKLFEFASGSEQQLFAQLLTLPDEDLLKLLLGESVPQSQEIGTLAAKIMASASNN